MHELLGNHILIGAVLSWFFAQFIKLITNCIKEKKLDLLYMFSSGGMPSSHASTVTGLATMTGLVEGWGSTYFAIAAILAIIVMYDARGVRLAVSKQAVILNHMVKERKFDFENLNELVGHTQTQVMFGALLGVVIACLYNMLVTVF